MMWLTYYLNVFKRDNIQVERIILATFYTVVWRCSLQSDRYNYMTVRSATLKSLQSRWVCITHLYDVQRNQFTCVITDQF